MDAIRRTAVIAAITAATLSFGGVAAAATPAVPPAPQSVTTTTDRYEDRRLPAVAARWASAWNSGDPQQLAALFTADARYTDHAFGATSTGRDGIAQWSTITAQSIDDAEITVHSAFRSGHRVAITWTFSGRLAGAPAPFSVPAVTVLQLRGQRIVENDDYYNLADVLRQSGLPADTTFGG